MFDRICRSLKNRRGFTLVELMVVVAIIGILVGIAVPLFNKSTSSAEKKACHANQRIIEGAAMQYYAEKNTWPSDVEALVNEGYLQEEPKCPLSKSGYTINDKGKVTGVKPPGSGGTQCNHGYYANDGGQFPGSGSSSP
ncbi:prepilin-type N-terminal cleavage/methylation domain-containing protein [Desulfohalotomaculum tongense]|uniref:competence type IV pilus major pilin ComGC n=1 Tax=Desulforadius tongensis TaxID=1216062 RepID=UPI00195717E5|nr:prepilin-type N-terminal cleavage/methylation domain-containing protein [Desulforadius tongensis]MBM7854068.1 prepilin-type N-terminal cleavage/methylation domain-containing protein [Desulforadius tongensis]